jgi:hypothetical protein
MISDRRLWLSLITGIALSLLSVELVQADDATERASDGVSTAGTAAEAAEATGLADKMGVLSKGLDGSNFGSKIGKGDLPGAAGQAAGMWVEEQIRLSKQAARCGMRAGKLTPKGVLLGAAAAGTCYYLGKKAIEESVEKPVEAGVRKGLQNVYGNNSGGSGPSAPPASHSPSGPSQQPYVPKQDYSRAPPGLGDPVYGPQNKNQYWRNSPQPGLADPVDPSYGPYDNGGFPASPFNNSVPPGLGDPAGYNGLALNPDALNRGAASGASDGCGPMTEQEKAWIIANKDPNFENVLKGLEGANKNLQNILASRRPYKPDIDIDRDAIEYAETQIAKKLKEARAALGGCQPQPQACGPLSDVERQAILTEHGIDVAEMEEEVQRADQRFAETNRSYTEYLNQGIITPEGAQAEINAVRDWRDGVRNGLERTVNDYRAKQGNCPPFQLSPQPSASFPTSSENPGNLGAIERKHSAENRRPAPPGYRRISPNACRNNIGDVIRC